MITIEEKRNIVIWHIEACDIGISFLETSIAENIEPDHPEKPSRIDQLKDFKLKRAALQKALDELI